MFGPVFRFEFNYHRRQYLFYILSGVFFILTFLATTSDNVSLGGSFGNININAPTAVISTLSTLSILALFGAVAFSASGVIRDYELKTAELFLSTNVSKADYLYGRFFGALIFSFGIYFAGLLGLVAGELAPWLDQERIGDFSWQAYWFASWAIVLPNLFFMSCIFFCLATVTRSMMFTYVAAIAFLMLTFVIGALTDQETIKQVSKFEPFGLAALGEQTRYWTVFERNAQIPLMEGNLLINRAIWMTAGISFLAAAYFLFPFSVEKVRFGKRVGKKAETTATDSAATPNADGTISIPTVEQRFDFAGNLAQFLSQTRMEFRNIVFSAPFVVLLLLGLLNVVGAAVASLEDLFGTPVYPTTPTLILLINGSLSLSLLGVLMYYAGEIMMKERNANFSEIHDSLPYPNWVMISAKLSGLILVVVMMLVVAAIAAIAVQLFNGYYEFDLLVYAQGLLFFFQFPLYFMCVMAVFFFVVTRNRYITMFLVVLYAILMISLPQLGFEHYLYRFNKPGVPYSVFTGYSHLLATYLWYSLYLSLWGLLLLLAIHLLWPRGSEFTIRTTLAVAQQRFTFPVKIAGAGTFMALVMVGGFIYYNTTQLNKYETNLGFEEQQANYEKDFKQYENLNQPVPGAVYAEVDLYPAERDVVARGHYDLQNLSEESIDELHLVLPPWVQLVNIEIPGATLNRQNEDHGYRIFEFDEPLAPGQSLRMSFETAWLTPGFKNNLASMKLTANGTFFNNFDLFPAIGYQRSSELQDNARRRKFDLPPVHRMPDIDDAKAKLRVGFGSANRVDFETIVSTSEDQTAIAPGYLQSKWQKDGRNYFHYKMDEPIWNFFSYLSGDYEMRSKQWNDVAIEIYYKHDYNVDRMIYATERSLEYFEQEFTPYQYRQFRIIEFPRYQGSFAQSFPNTIPFSESIGFVADLRDKTHIDYVFYVTAHELAHQWWAHQVLGADVQGQTMIVETLAQYFALMVMKNEYGEDTMKKFLEYELDRYLQSRGGELIEELPLYLVENQPYIHYRKGSVALYALQDYIGEDVINAALRQFLNEYAFKAAPYPTTKDLIAIIRHHAGPEHQDLITDLLEKIILFDLKVDDTQIVETEDGKFEVTIEVSLAKYEANGAGEETEVDVAGSFDIALLGAKDEATDVHDVLYLGKHPINSTSETITIISEQKPDYVGIDPFNKLIDRNPEDNIMSTGS